MRSAVIGVLALAGCLRDPVFGHGDAPSDGSTGDADSCHAIPYRDLTASDDGILATLDPFGAILGGGTYRVGVAQIGTTAAAFPSQLTVAGTSILYTAPDGCDAPGGMGIVSMPMTQITGVDAGEGLTAPYAGPVIGQLAGTWSKVLDCPAAGNTIRGQTTFTGFPDGRIVRSDVLTLDAPATIGMCALSCGLATDFVIRSFTELTRTAADHDGACVEAAPGLHAAFAFEGSSTLSPPVELTGGPGYWKLDYQLQTSPSLPAGLVGSVSTTMYVSSTAGCTALNGRLALDHPNAMNRPQLVVNGQQAEMDPTDGIYRVPTAEDLQTTTQVVVRPNQAIGDGFAVELDLGVYTALRGTRDTCADQGEWFSSQPSLRGTLLWFSGALPQDGQITLDVVR